MSPEIISNGSRGGRGPAARSMQVETAAAHLAGLPRWVRRRLWSSVRGCADDSTGVRLLDGNGNEAEAAVEAFQVRKGEAVARAASQHTRVHERSKQLRGRTLPPQLSVHSEAVEAYGVHRGLEGEPHRSDHGARRCCACIRRCAKDVDLVAGLEPSAL
eukprot:scaffold104281_cov65-Phaeocystis_antarctica.AAC.1